MKRSAEALIAFLDGVAEFCTETAAAKFAGIHRQTAARWQAESREAAKTGNTNSNLYFEYPEGSGNVAFLHEHRRLIEKNAIGDILGGAIRRARDGVKQPTMYQGQTVYKLNPKFEETAETRKIETDADLYIFGYETRWLRDAGFNRIPECVWTPPTNELTLSVLAAYTKKFSKRSTVSVEHSGGVLVAHQVEAPRERLPAPLPVLEVIAEEAITDMSNVREPEEIQPSPIAKPEPAPAPPPAPRRELTELQRDLLDRARQRGIEVNGY